MMIFKANKLIIPLMRLYLLLVFGTLNQGCWIISGDAPLRKKEITGNEIPRERQEVEQEVRLSGKLSFGELKHDEKPLEGKILTRRQYFGDLTIPVSVTNSRSSQYSVTWTNKIGGQEVYSGKGGWLDSSNDGDNFNGTAIIKNIRLKNQVDNNISFYLLFNGKMRLMGEVIVFADFTPPEINIDIPEGIKFDGEDAIAPIWFESSRGTMSGGVSDNIGLKNLSFRLEDGLETRSSEPFVEIEINNGRWVLDLELPAGSEKKLELRATDIFGNNTYKRARIGVDQTGPLLVFTNATGVREFINVNQGESSWDVSTSGSFDNPIELKSTSDQSIKVVGRVFDEASGAKEVSLSVCKSSLGCDSEGSWVRVGTVKGEDDAFLDRWNFNLSASFDVNSVTANVTSGRNRLKLEAKDFSDNVSVVYIDFIIDNVGPIINSLIFFDENDVPLVSSPKRIIDAKLSLVDHETKLTKYCVKIGENSPDLSHPCWKDIYPPVNDLIETVSIELGYFPKQYNVYAWAIDEVGNFSDRIGSNIYFTPTSKPELFEIQVGNTTNLTYWPTRGEMRTSDDPFENNIIIKWRVHESEKDNISHVNISYRKEFKSVVNVAQNLFNGVNPGGCTVEPPFHGCYVWRGETVPLSDTMFTIRVDIFDTNGQSDGGNSNFFNDKTFQYYALGFRVFGDNQLGTNHLASSDHFKNIEGERNQLIVTENGTVFILDSYRGLLKIDSNDGKTSLIVNEPWGVSGNINGWNSLSYLKQIKILDNYLYFKDVSHNTGRIEITDLASGELANFEASIPAATVPANLWDADVPPVHQPNHHASCSYLKGADQNYYCYASDSKSIYKFKDNVWSSVLTGNPGDVCLDGKEADKCYETDITSYYVDHLGTVFFVDGRRIRYKSPDNKVFTIYGKKPDSENTVYGSDMNQKSGRLARLPMLRGSSWSIDWAAQIMSYENYFLHENFGKCDDANCNKSSTSEEGFSYRYYGGGGFYTVFKDNIPSPPTQPVVSINQGTLTGDRTVIKTRAIKLGIDSADKNGNIEKICVKYNVDPSVAIFANDSCWVNLIDHDQITYSTNEYKFNIGFVAGDYDLYVWVMDDDGDISPPSDKLALSYQPGRPPELFSVLATNRNIPSSSPSSFTDLIIDNENRSAFIKWVAADFDENTGLKTLEGLKINLYYSHDNIEFIPISGAQNLSPSMSSVSCTVNSPDEVLGNVEGWTGCYEWPVPSALRSEMLFIRVEAIDNDFLGASALAPPLNAGNLSILAGDIDKGIGGQARSAMFTMPAHGSSDRGGWSFPDSFVVDSSGVTYFLDTGIGILKIDPADGKIEVLIKIDKNYMIPNMGDASVDLSESKLRWPISIFLDYPTDNSSVENILVYDYNKIRKIDLKNKKVSTILGGGGTNMNSRFLSPEVCNHNNRDEPNAFYQYKFHPGSGLMKAAGYMMYQTHIGVDTTATVPSIGDSPEPASQARLVNPVSMYEEYPYIYILDDGFLRQFDMDTNEIKTVRQENTEINCGYVRRPSEFNFELIDHRFRPTLQANLRTIIPLPRGDMLIDYHGHSQKRMSNWMSYLDAKVPQNLNYDELRQGHSAEIHSGLWWYRPRDFSNPQPDQWEVYPIKFTDGDKACKNHGFTASFDADPNSATFGQIKKIYGILFGSCQMDDNDPSSNQQVLEFDASPLYEVQNAGESRSTARLLPWPRLKAINESPILNGLSPHYNSTDVGRNGYPVLYNRAMGRAYKFDDSRVVTWFLGDASGATCTDGKSARLDDCNIELLDMFTTADGTHYFWDLSQIRSIIEGEVFTLFGKPPDHGDGGLSTSARFSFISDFGLYGRDDGGMPNQSDIMIMDIYSRKFRSVVGGKINTHFGTGHYGLNRLSELDISGAGEHNIPFEWGDESYYVRKSFSVDADGNIYYPSRGGLGYRWWLFDNIKVSYDSFYSIGGVPTNIRKMSPITQGHQGTTNDETKFNQHQIGDVISDAVYADGRWTLIGHVFGIDQDRDYLLLHMNSIGGSDGGVIYTMNLSDTVSKPYIASGSFSLFQGQNFELPKIADVLAYSDGSNNNLCHLLSSDEGQSLDQCKIDPLPAYEPSYRFFEDSSGRKFWASWSNRQIFSMEEISGSGFGKIRNLHLLKHGGVTGLDIRLINNERILAYCNSGALKVVNLESGVESNIEFKINGMACSKGGLEFIFNDQTNKFSIVSAVTYRGLHAIVEIALPSSPKVTKVSLANDVSNNVNSNKVDLLISGSDPKEPLAQYCVAYNNSAAPSANDACWNDILINNTLGVDDYQVEAKVGTVEGDYSIFVWLKDKYGEISGISNNGVGSEGVDKVSITYTPAVDPTINNFIVSTTSGATEVNFSNTRDVRNTIDRYYISWNLDGTYQGLEVDLDLTMNGIDYYPVARGLNGYAQGCPNGFSGCYTWINFSDFLDVYVPNYLKDSPFQVKLTIKTSDGRVFSFLSSPIGSNAFGYIGENFHGIGSGWESYMHPYYKQIYDPSLHVNQLIPQQFVVSPRGDILINHPRDGVLRLNIDSGKTEVLFPKRANSSIGDNGNDQRWIDAAVDNVGKITIDHNNNIYFTDEDHIRSFNISDPRGIIQNFSTLSLRANMSLFHEDQASTPFFFKSDYSYFHLVTPSASKSANFLNFNIELMDSSGVKVIKDIDFNDFKSKVKTWYRQGDVSNLETLGFIIKQEIVLLNSGVCGSSGERMEVDLNTCTIENYFNSNFELPDFLFIAECGCSNGNAGKGIGAFHVRPFLDLDTDELDYTSDISRVEEILNWPSDEVAKDGFYFPAMDNRLYLIYKGSQSQHSSHFGGIWAYEQSAGWARILGKDTGDVGVCEHGQNALSCNASPEDLFVTQHGEVYFIEGNHIKKIDNGVVKFVTGRRHKESSNTSATILQAGLLTSVSSENNISGVDDILNQIVYPHNGGVVIANKSNPTMATLSTVYGCGEDGFICELGPVGTGCTQVFDLDTSEYKDSQVFPFNSDFLFRTDTVKLGEKNNNIYKNDWRCVGDVYEESGFLYVPYYHRGSGGIMRLLLQ